MKTELKRLEVLNEEKSAELKDAQEKELKLVREEQALKDRINFLTKPASSQVIKITMLLIRAEFSQTFYPLRDAPMYLF